ncbi:putative tail assembly protein [Rhizobium phage RHph_X2_30]|nr:putative tail assembly protein [Rhizobium phage RHph_X2_30]
MAIEVLPVWPFEANWSGRVTEALEWLTDVLTSPSGAEQRRCLRLYPRKMIEFSCALGGNERAVFDQFLSTHGGRTFYLPQWHESYRSGAAVAAGATSIPCDSANNGGLRVGDVIFISGNDPRHYELAEVSALSSSAITLVSPLVASWPTFSKVHPVRKAHLDDQPTLRRVTDTTITFTATFRIMQRNDDVDIVLGPSVTTDLLEIYQGFNVLSAVPDERESLDVGITRMIDVLDNEVGIPLYNDVAGIPFKSQKFNWVLHGRGNYDTLKKTFYHLRGRAIPIWLPTFFNDMQMVGNTVVGGTLIKIQNIGFTVSGGVETGREYIMVTRVDGSNTFHRIMSSAVDGDNEIIGVDTPFASGLAAASVMRISFMALNRLDQDRIEIIHHTDTRGAAACTTTFRAAPDLRVVQPGF